MLWLLRERNLENTNGAFYTSCEICKYIVFLLCAGLNKMPFNCTWWEGVPSFLLLGILHPWVLLTRELWFIFNLMCLLPLIHGHTSCTQCHQFWHLLKGGGKAPWSSSPPSPSFCVCVFEGAACFGARTPGAQRSVSFLSGELTCAGSSVPAKL